MTIGIYVSEGYWNGGNTENITVKSNLVVGTAQMVYPYEIGTEVGNNIIGVDFLHNVAIGGLEASLRFGASAFGYIQNVNIYNNTFYNSYRGIEATGPPRAYAAYAPATGAAAIMGSVRIPATPLGCAFTVALLTASSAADAASNRHRPEADPVLAQT